MKKKKQSINFQLHKQEVTPVKTILESPEFLFLLLSDERMSALIEVLAWHLFIFVN